MEEIRVIRGRTVYYCANPDCRTELVVDHVTMTTTTHVRRFCSVDCIADGLQAVRELIAQEND